MERSIIHLNIADFAVAVENSIQPSLKGYPVIIAPPGAPRAVVYDMSEQAFQLGIRKGMSLTKARKLDKKIKILPPSFIRYEKAMKSLLNETFMFTPLIESGHADGHIFMDVTNSSRLFGPPVDMAFKLKQIFKKNFGLNPIWSTGTSKLVAKVATRLVKPAGEYIVPPGDESAFLAPLPLKLIPGIKKTDLSMLHDFNLFKVCQARSLTREQLIIPFDQRASLIYNHIRGIDRTPVTTAENNSSTIRADHEFNTDTNQMKTVRRALYSMIEKICSLLRKKNLHTRTATIILAHSDGLQNQAKTIFKDSTSCDMVLFKHCLPVLIKAWKRRVRIRHISITCEQCAAQNTQGLLFSPGNKQTRQKELVKTMDKIRKKFGKSAIQTGLTLEKRKIS